MNRSQQPVPPQPRKMTSWLLRLARGLVLAYLVVLLLMLWLENWLIFPAPKYPSGDWDPQRVAAEDVFFTSADGTQLHGWYWEHPQPRAHLLYCHGNGDCVAYHAEYLRRLSEAQQISIFSFDYRGYGRSSGNANEPGVLLDSAAARDWLAQRANVQPEQLVLMGRSLGGAAVVHLAAEKGARGLILQSTFTSMPDVAAPLYWFLPVRLVMQTQLNSAKKISSYQGPLMQSHGTADSLVPYANGQRLFSLAPGEKTWFAVEGGDHNDSEPSAYYEVLDAFLEKLPPENRE